MVGSITLLLGLVSVLFSKYVNSNVTSHPEARLTSPQIIRRNGYKAETHAVQTSDGYLLSIHRIPRGLKDGPRRSFRPPVYLQHGIMASSADWLLSGPQSALAYKLADAGFDVWMGNARGNSYSKGHITLSPDEGQFWKFSWDEMAEYDLAAVLDYITEETRFESVTYIGHSMGTTIFFALMSSQPLYQRKVNLMFALAPVVSVTHIATPLKVLSSAQNMLKKIGQLVGKGELLPGASVIRYWHEQFCSTSTANTCIPYGQYIKDKIESWAVYFGLGTECADIFFGFAGYDFKNFNKGVPALINAHFPQETSLLTAVQYAQQINSGEFRKFDRQDGNKRKYNATKPPVYDLSLVKTPVIIFTADNDTLVHTNDVENLQNKLPNIEKTYRIANFNHIDYLYHIEAPKLVYKVILEKLNETKKVMCPRKNRRNMGNCNSNKLEVF